MTSFRRDVLKFGALGLAGGAIATGGATLMATQAAAQSAPDSLLRKVIDRGHLLMGTGSTNAPWHFEDEAGKLVGMDVTMGRMLAKALFDDVEKVEFVIQDPAQRIPNVNTGKTDICCQFMTMSFQRAQLVNFSRPYYTEGVALISSPNSRYKTFEELKAAGKDANVSVLQNVNAENLVYAQLPEATPMLIDTQANVLQAVESKRADAAVVDLSTVRWLVARNPDRYVDAGKHWGTQLYGAAMKQGDPDWLHFVNTVFTIGMYGHDTQIYDEAFKTYFGEEPPARTPGFPKV